jgi:hypothetical protein
MAVVNGSGRLCKDSAKQTGRDDKKWGRTSFYSSRNAPGPETARAQRIWAKPICQSDATKAVDQRSLKNGRA